MSRINTRAELARELGVSRTYVTLLCQGKRQLSRKLVNKLAKLQLAHDLEVDMHKHEHLTFNQGVTGSNPVRPTIRIQSCRTRDERKNFEKTRENFEKTEVWPLEGLSNRHRPSIWSHYYWQTIANHSLF
jgi:transcriptional regulator with XRE-family HTH domain